MRGETEAAGGIGEYSQVIPQRPARTATAPGRSLGLRPHMLLAQVLEMSLGANLNQGKGKDIIFEHTPSFEMKRELISDEAMDTKKCFLIIIIPPEHLNLACCQYREESKE